MDRIPSITQQVHAEMVEHRSATGRAYNSGLIKLGEALVMTTRHFNPAKGRCEIVLNLLNGRETKRVKVMKLPDPLGHEQFEDARLFWHGDKVMMAYTEGHYVKLPWRSIQRLVELDDDLDVARTIEVRYGLNFKRSEKNWQFFSRDGRLFFVYSISPHIVVEIDDDGKVLNEWKTNPPLHWPEGTMSGGTPPFLMTDGRYISFFHSFVAHPERIRRYSFSAYTFAGDAPFAIESITLPIAHASGNDPELPNPSIPYWRPYVVFPAGHIMEDGVHILSVGINDSYDAIIQIPNCDLKLLPIAAFASPRLRYFKTTNATRPIRVGTAYLEWQATKGPRSILLGNMPGVLAVDDPAVVELVASRAGVKEIPKDEYLALK